MPHSWVQFVWILLAGIIAAGAAYLVAIFNFKKTSAEARSLDMETNIKGGDWVMHVAQQMAEATVQLERVKQEREFWRHKADEYEKAVAHLEAEVQLLYLQVGQFKNRTPPRSLTGGDGI